MNISEKKVLIIAPRTIKSIEDYHKYILPVGLACISSVLKNNGYHVNILNLNSNIESVDEIVKKTLSRDEYNFILSGGLSVHYYAVKCCVDSARKYAPLAKIILGGGLISSVPKLMFNALQPDYIVIGEGELTILELLQKLENNGNLSEVDGIGFQKTNGEVMLTKHRRPISDIDTLPWPDYEGFGFDILLDQIKPSTLYYYDVLDDPRQYPILASRSCPYLCTFCYHPLGNKYRQRSIPNIIDELYFAIERYKINIIDFYDELFANDRDRIYDLCKQLKQLFQSVPWEIKWNCQLRMDSANEELVKIMKDTGCYLVSLGLESYSSTVLRSMRKKINPKQIDNTLDIMHNQQMTITGNFIFGDIAETTETAYKTLGYWKKNYHTILRGAIALGFIQVYPGTALYSHCLEKRIITNEIDFIESHLGEPINITENINEYGFNKLKRDIRWSMLRYPKYQRPLLLRKINGISEMHVKCPYCNLISSYKNYENHFHRKAICCRNCRMRFWIVSLGFKLYILIIKIIGAKNVHLLDRVVRFYSSIKRSIRKVIEKLI